MILVWGAGEQAKVIAATIVSSAAFVFAEEQFGHCRRDDCGVETVTGVTTPPRRIAVEQMRPETGPPPTGHLTVRGRDRPR